MRSKLEAEGLKPALLDTFRPAEEKQFGFVRRLLRTGVTRFVVAGERSDAATIARDAGEAGLAFEIIGGEALLDEPPDAAELPVGTLAVAPLSRFADLLPAGDPDAAVAQGYFGAAFVGIEIAADALRTASGDGRSIAAVLDSLEFSTALGSVRFDPNGDGNLDLFRTYRFDGRDFVAETDG